MKKMISFMLGLMLVVASLAGCSSDGNSSAQESYGSDSSAVEESSTADESSAAEESSTATAGMTGAISVISREDGSGTRSAFIELMGIEQDDVDMTTEMAEITNSTSVMMTTVAGNTQAIGYVSLGSLDETQVKAVQVNGVAPSADAVKDGSYSVSRPFNIATMGEPEGLAADFINFIMSDEGQAIVEEEGYISQGSTGAFEGTLPEGEITVGGSSSVTPVMEKLIEGYQALNANANIQLQQSDSTTGMNSAIDGSYDIGMASREVSDSELEAGLQNTVIALDGIAVIVNLENPINNLTSEQIMQIYTGEVTDWDAIEESAAPAEDSTAEESSSESAAAAGANGMTGAISVISREDGSGTRSAFIELMGIEQDDVDMTTEMAEITNSTSVMMTTVAGNTQAIGYVSLGSLDETQVKAVQVNGVAPSADAVKDGSYSVSRPFNIATMGEPEGLAADFINFIMSDEGQAIVEEEGYISQGSTGAFEGTLPEGEITVGGSSSVTPVMEKLIEGYQALNANANIQLQQSDSTTGMNSAIDGSYDIGMASREVSDSELEAGLQNTVIALDGIAVIVNLENPAENLTSEQIMQIYTGEVTQWEDLQ